MSGAKKIEILQSMGGHPAEVVNAAGQAAICLVCEHASASIPSAFGDLGIAKEHRFSHAAWDIGAEALARELSKRLDAPLVLARVSRLVYDLNRSPDAPDAIPVQSDDVVIPENAGLTASDRAARVAAIYEPFHAALSDVLDNFRNPPVFVTIHSFTPKWGGKARQTELGILHDAHAGLANAMMQHADPSLLTELNEPYSASDGVTHTLRKHAERRGLTNVMIEVRNDLLATQSDVSRIASILTTMLTRALSEDMSAV